MTHYQLSYYTPMKKVIETLLHNPAARASQNIRSVAYSQTAFTPWEAVT